MTCRDCSKTMNEKDLSWFRSFCFVAQRVDDAEEGLCEPCFLLRYQDGENMEDIIYEFCG